MNRILLFVACLFLTVIVHAQIVNVTVKVVNAKGEALPFSTITILPVADTAAAQTKLADSTGAVLFTLQQNGLYKVRLSSVSYEPLEKSITVKPGATSFRFIMQPL